MQALEQLGVKETALLNRDNKMLVLYAMHKALEAMRDSPEEIQYTIMTTLACCYQDRGFFHEAIYWYTKCLESGCCGRPLDRLHTRGNLILILINLNNMPDAGQMLSAIPDDPPETAHSCGAGLYREHLRALRLYYEVKKQSLEEEPDTAAASDLTHRLLLLCTCRDRYLLLQRIRLDALNVSANLCLEKGDLDGAAAFFRQKYAAACRLGDLQKAADSRKSISMIYEAAGDTEQAFRHYKKYYKLSAGLSRKKSDDFSEYLFEMNHLNETEQEIENLRKMKEYLSDKRNIDPLTGVYNRRFWDEALEQRAACCGPDAVFSILMLDIDAFKQFNDSFGHLEGDRALKAIGSLLRGCLRINADVLARFGGDEFVILADGMDESESKRLAERILAGMRDSKFSGGNITLTMSIGIATGHIGRERSFSVLMEEADAALYYSKYSGKNKCTHMLDIKRDGVRYD